MKFSFKIQSYQSEAVESVIGVFAGQRRHEGITYLRDVGKQQMPVGGQQLEFATDDDLNAGFRNADIELTDSELLKNIQSVQGTQNIGKAARV